MSKKNYYDILGVSPSTTPEQIWEHFRLFREAFYAKDPPNSPAEWEKSEAMFVSIIGVLTDAEEKKRYDQHLQQFGSDENFSSNYYFEAEVFARMEESVKLERIARIEKVTVKISEKEDEIDGVEEKEIAKLKIIYKERRILRYVALLTRKWNCDFCGRTYPSLIQYKEKIAVGKEFDCKFCLACFAYVQGKLVGQGEKEQTTRLMKIIKKIEDEFEEAKGFCFVSYRITSWKVEEEED